MNQSHQPFVIRLSPASSPAPGPLQGLAFAVKDNIDVAGVVTGNGNPYWAETHAVPSSSAPVVTALQAAGGTLAGKTTMDELAFGLTGRNMHYGTPRNPVAPQRVPGGSSSGSAVAVAEGLVDFALGTDTGGSVRIPASFCGTWGFRPTHGRVSMEGVVPLAPSFDTLGWLARDAGVLERIGRVLVGPGDDGAESAEEWDGTIRVAEDLFEICAPAAGAAMERALGLLGRWGARVSGFRLGRGSALEEWGQAFCILQSVEIWACHRAWYEAAHPTVAPDVAARLALASRVGPDEVRQAQATREEVARVVRRCTREGVFVCLPTAPFVAPLLDFDVAEMDAVRASILVLTCVAGLAGAPQMTFPALSLEGAPLGLSLVGHPGADLALLECGLRFAGVRGG